MLQNRENKNQQQRSTLRTTEGTWNSEEARMAWIEKGKQLGMNDSMYKEIGKGACEDFCCLWSRDPGYHLLG